MESKRVTEESVVTKFLSGLYLYTQKRRINNRIGRRDTRQSCGSPANRSTINGSYSRDRSSAFRMINSLSSAKWFYWLSFIGCLWTSNFVLRR